MKRRITKNKKQKSFFFDDYNESEVILDSVSVIRKRGKSNIKALVAAGRKRGKSNIKALVAADRKRGKSNIKVP